MRLAPCTVYDTTYCNQREGEETTLRKHSPLVTAVRKYKYSHICDTREKAARKQTKQLRENAWEPSLLLRGDWDRASLVLFASGSFSFLDLLLLLFYLLDLLR